MIEDIFAKVADYHMGHRGHIGFALGIVGAVLCVRSGLDHTITGMALDFLLGSDNVAREQLQALSSLTGVPSMVIVTGAVVTDAVIHKRREADKAAEAPPEDKGPQPPAP
jgi:hypothetical protein